MPISYYEQLKTNLTADANAKKAALDAMRDAYTQAQFDAAGNVSYKEPGRLGTRDVQYDTQTRAIKTGAEQSGMLRSGQSARNLAENLASYKADVLGSASQLTADKAAIDTGLSSSIAEAQAKYGSVPSSSSTATAPPPAASSQPTAISEPPKPQGRPEGPSLAGAGIFPVPATTSAATFRRAEEATRKPAPKAAPKPAPKPTPKKVVPKRIGGY